MVKVRIDRDKVIDRVTLYLGVMASLLNEERYLAVVVFLVIVDVVIGLEK